MSTKVAALKEQLEQLFPGKWFAQGSAQPRNLVTGIQAIDVGVARGLVRRRVSEWTGGASSGKTTVLRAAIANWCASGMHVVYIDTSGRLVAADWAYVEEGHSGGVPLGVLSRPNIKGKGKFWVVRNLYGLKQDEDAIWAAEQLIRSNIFDVVVLESVRPAALTSRAYARLQRALDRTRASLIIVRDDHPSQSSSSSWGCHTRLGFGWVDPIQCEEGLTGIVAISPTIGGTVWKDGLSQNIEVSAVSHVSNCLFTHPQVPDRRAPKARTNSQKQAAGVD